jgi:tetratricopeptide (TPR) repeat protein
MVVCLTATLLALAAAPAAQKDAFRDALVGFHSRLAGEYGNEGPLVTANLERMASALSAWDAAIRSAETDVRPRLATAAPAERARLRTTLAELYVERGRYADAMREIDAAIAADATRDSLHVFRGLVLEAVGRQQDASAAFRRAWEIDRDDPVSAYLAASRRAAQTAADEAIPQTAPLVAALSRRLTAVPSDRQIPLFQELALLPDRTAVTPVFSPALYAEGLTLVIEGRYAEAIASFRRAVARDPLVTAAGAQRPSETHRILAGTYADAGNDAKSIEELEIAAGLAPDDERVGVALGRALARTGQVERAERVLRNIVSRVPQSADAHSALADLYESSNRGRDALHEVEVTASFTVLAGKGALYFRLADLEHRHLEYERVIAPLVRRVRLNPNDARAHTDLGLAYTRIGQTGNALVELIAASLIGPDDAEALTAIGQIHFDAGSYAAAEAVLRRAIAIAPALVQARYLIGRTLARLGRTAESQEQLAEFDRLRADANAATRRAFEIEYQRLLQEQQRRER